MKMKKINKKQKIKKNILIISIYTIFVVLNEIVFEIGIDDIWDRLVAWTHKDKNMIKN